MVGAAYFAILNRTNYRGVTAITPLGPKIDPGMTAITPLDPKFGKNARNDRYKTTRSKSRPVLYLGPELGKNGQIRFLLQTDLRSEFLI